MQKIRLALLLISLCVTTQALSAVQVNVVGLFTNKVIVMINGAGPYSLAAGQTKNGVTLVSADSNTAHFLVEGKRQVLGMGQAVSVGTSAATADGTVNTPVNLYADSEGHFFGQLVINGVTLKYLVDTGATSVAMNSGDAKYAKIDYQQGKKIQVSTANGITSAHLLKLNTIKIGTIVLHNIDVTVLDGGSPPFVLLGMSAQNRLDMKRQGAVLTMTKKY
jgi:aspartyl protease family protein